MRRRLLTYTLPAALAGLILWACQHDRFGHDDPNAVEPTLTVGEAQSIFERQFSEMLPYMTKAAGDMPVGMTPGDFTPLWNKARIGANREMDGADIPIDPKFIFVAVFNRITEKGDTVRQTVDITQKLVVKKWRDTTECMASSYIATIVPTPEYYARHRNVAKDFQYAGSKGEFSGFVVYQTLDGLPVAIDNYRDGKPVRHDYFPRITEQNLDSVANVMDEAMGEVSFLAGTPRSFGLGTEEDPLKPDQEVTVTAKRNSGADRWLITITYRPSGLPTGGNPNPSDITYITPNIPTGGGGSTGNHSQDNGRPIKFTDDCSGNKTTIKTAAGNLLEIMKNVPKLYPENPTFQEFMQTVQNNMGVEHSMVLKADFHTGNIYFGNIRSAEKSDDFIDVENNNLTIGIIHSHPDSHMTPPSALDVVDLGGQLAEGNNDVQASYVVVRDNIYCLQVTDPEKAKAFAAANPIPEGESSFPANSSTGKLWRDGSERMRSVGGYDDQYCATMAYVLERADAGITLLRLKPGKKMFEAYGLTTNANGEYYPTWCR